jgi:hypothetical protein
VGKEFRNTSPGRSVTSSRSILLRRATCGPWKQIDVEKSVAGITGGKLRKELAILGRISGPKGLSLAITAGWGHFQKDDVVMPGSGLSKERDFSDAERLAITEGAEELDMDVDDILTIWGNTAVDIHLNAETFWGTVPNSVWEYTIGGYLVLKKWLSYRERTILGREITKDEARVFTHMVRRIAALLPILDSNYLAVKSSTYLLPNTALAAPAAVDPLEGEHKAKYAL